MEVIGLKKKDKKSYAYVKFNNNSVTLDEILDCQRSPFDKFGLGYNKERGKFVVSTWSPKTPEASLSTSKNQSKAPREEPAQHKEDFRRSERRQEVGPTPQFRFKRETTPRWNQAPRYEDFLMDIAIPLMISVINLWITDSMIKEVLEVSTT